MDGDRGSRAAEDVFPLLSHALFALERELVVAEVSIKRGPRFVSAGEAVPVRALFWEAPPRQVVSRWRLREATCR